MPPGARWPSPTQCSLRNTPAWADLLAARDATRAEAPLADGFYRLPVNTSHHQAVSEPGSGLHLCGRCPEDGVVEALESDSAAGGRNDLRIIGVQWHPERSYDISPASRALFAHLIAKASLQFISGGPR